MPSGRTSRSCASGFIAEDTPEPTEAGTRAEGGLAALRSKLLRHAGSPGSVRGTAIAGLGHASASLLLGCLVHGLTGSLPMAFLVAGSDLILRPVLHGGAWTTAHAAWRRRRARNQSLWETVLGDGI